MANPHIHVALIGLGQGSQAAHQEQAVDRQLCRRRARLVGKRAGQALGFGQGRAVRLIPGNPGRRAARHITGQQRVIHMKKQRQQAQHRLLTRGQALRCPQQACAIDVKKPITQMSECLSVNTFIQIYLNFLGARHIKLKPAR